MTRKLGKELEITRFWGGVYKDDCKDQVRSGRNWGPFRVGWLVGSLDIKDQDVHEDIIYRLASRAYRLHRIHDSSPSLGKKPHSPEAK